MVRAHTRPSDLQTLHFQEATRPFQQALQMIKVSSSKTKDFIFEKKKTKLTNFSGKIERCLFQMCYGIDSCAVFNELASNIDAI